MIFLHEPNICGDEWKYVKECLNANWVSSAGEYVDLFEERVAQYTGSKYAIACMNGTSALQVSLKLSGVLPNDEVIVPTITFIAPVNAIAYNGATPVFMDADDYYNIDTEKTVDFINKETVFKDGFTFNKKTNQKISAIIPIHVFGHAARLDDLVQLCGDRNITIVEDAAESMGTFYIKGKYSSKHTGTIGLLGCLSFNGNKIITTGGGGMILTDNAELAERARYLTTQAKNDSVRYVHNDIGYNFRLTNIQAALGVAQLEKLLIFLDRKRKIFHKYQNAFNDMDGLFIADVPDYADNNHWMNVLQIDNEINGEDRDSIMQRLDKNGIQTRPVWGLNHLQKPYRDCQNYRIERAEGLLNNSLCLPSSSNLTDENLNYVITQLNG